MVRATTVTAIKVVADTVVAVTIADLNNPWLKPANFALKRNGYYGRAGTVLAPYRATPEFMLSYARAFLVTGDQQRDGALGRRFGQQSCYRRHETGDTALHVGGAAPKQLAIHDRGGEGFHCPALAHRHHIRMPGEAEIGRLIPQAGIEITDLRPARMRADMVAGEAKAFQCLGQHIHGPGIVWGDAGAAEQGLGQADGIAKLGQSRSNSLMETLERVRSSTFLTMTAQ